MAKGKPIVARTLEKNKVAVQLELRIVTHADGKSELQSTLKHYCKDKQSAIELINEYVKHNTRVKVDA